jgi:hypothetical protein
MKWTMVCVGGPYAGQTVLIDKPAGTWDYSTMRADERRYDGVTPFDVDIFDGTVLHRYVAASNGYKRCMRLEYQGPVTEGVKVWQTRSYGD